jgi:5'-nucleotidase
LLGLADLPVDMVVSGINPHANLGHDVTYSGTVTAAMEAVIAGVPALAISLDSPEDLEGPRDYGPAAAVAAALVAQAAGRTWPKGVLLNVNVPYGPIDGMSGLAVTRQGLRLYRDELVRREDPRGRPYYWIGGEAPTGVAGEGTDVGSLAAGFVSVTPLQLDLTAHASLESLRGWGLHLA